MYFLTSTDSTSYSAANLTLAVGRALERVVSLINRNDSRWQWDDSNYTDLPSATLTVTSGQQQYTLATSHRTIDRIEVKDSGGSWKRLLQIDQQNLKRGATSVGVSGQISNTQGGDVALALGETTPSTGRTGAYKASTGVPTEYDVSGIRIYLFPVPNYTLAAAMRIYFTRTPLLFVYTGDAAGAFSDSTGSAASSPGFDPLFHDLLAQWASYDYERNFKKDNSRLTEIQRLELELVDSFGRRNRDSREGFTVSMDSNK